MIPSEEQRIIVENSNRNLFISAGPGAGKTLTISLIAEKLLQNPSNKLLLITFTNKASKNILKRVSNLDTSRIISGTFHGNIYRKLKEIKEFHICDENKKKLIIRKLFNCKRNQEEFEKFYKTISDIKSSYPMATLPEVMKYQEELKKYNMLDFEDLINVGIDMIKEKKIDFDVTHILVDELQDTSQNQLELLKAIKTQNINIIGVADNEQCIYSWRKARYENVEDFIKLFECKVYNLGTNYRSDIKIVEASNNLISHNINKIPRNIRANSKNQGIVHVYKAYDLFGEIDHIVSLCKSISKKIVILYRNRTNKMQLEYQFKKQNIRYTVNDNCDVTDRGAFRALLYTLRCSTGVYDVYDLEEAARGLKKLSTGTLKKLHGFEAKGQEFDQKVKELSKKDKRVATGISHLTELQRKFILNAGENLSNFIEIIDLHMIESFEVPKEIKNFLKEVCSSYTVCYKDVSTLFNEFGLDGKEETQDKDAKVMIGTIHNFKGLQSPVVIVPFVQTIVPRDLKDLEEERRVFYVAITRAETELYLTYSGDKPAFIKELYEPTTV